MAGEFPLCSEWTAALSSFVVCSGEKEVSCSLLANRLINCSAVSRIPPVNSMVKSEDQIQRTSEKVTAGKNVSFVNQIRYQGVSPTGWWPLSHWKVWSS